MCDLCRMEECSQDHQLQCEILKTFISKLNTTSVVYEDLFGNVDRQLEFIKLYSEVIRQREILHEALNII